MELSKVEKMSSREIAQLTGKNHADIMRDIRNLFEQVKAELGESSFALSSYLSNQNKELPQYLLTKKECLLLMSGYNPVLRLKIINRWEALETRTKEPLLNTKIHLQRYKLNEPNIPKGYFCMLKEMITEVIMELELEGKDLIDSAMPDSSLGIGFPKFLKKKGIDISDYPKYKQTLTNGKIVDARAYPYTVYHFFKEFVDIWIKDKGQKYFTEKTILLLKK